MNTVRKYPVGIQTFSEIRKGNYVYIDKTDLVWEITRLKYVFLSRPRRFGKSLLTTTLASYFRGQKELFEGLKIMALETEWEQYPVIHVDLSTAAYGPTKEVLRQSLLLLLSREASKHGLMLDERYPGIVLASLIRQVFMQTGKQVVLLIDEYDAPLLAVLGDKQRYHDYLEVMLEFFCPLKGSESMLRFCFITGVTAFPEPATFASFINLSDISLNPRYASICGITENELRETMDEDIELAAASNDYAKEELYRQLKLYYGGYHFARNSLEIYNPHCLMDFATSQMFQSYWFSSFLPSLIYNHLNLFKTNLNELCHDEFDDFTFYQYREQTESALPLLYHGGYLTIEDYDRISDSYILSVPNSEVYTDLLYGQTPLVTGLDPNFVHVNFAKKFWLSLKKNDLDTAMQEMKAFLAGIPYVEGFKEKLKDVKNFEGFYEYTFWLIFNMLNVYARTQVKCANGRIDFVVEMPDTTYVFELKVNGTAQEALNQINSKHYALPYYTEGRNVVKVGTAFERETMTVQEWIVE